MARIFALAVLGIFATAACGNHGSGVPGDGSAGGAMGLGGAVGLGGTSGAGGTRDPATVTIPDPISEPTFKSLIAELGCAAQAPCCAPGGYQYNPSSCQSLVAASWNKPPPNTTFDSASAVACLKTLQAKPACGSGNPASCNSVYRGTLAAGTACQSGAECAPSGNLVVTCDSTDQVCTTTSQGKLGDPCDQTCTAAAEGIPTCFTVFKANIYPVAPYAHVACDRAVGLFCDTSINQCATLKGAGGSCTGRSDCAVGMNCIVSGSKGTCQPSPSLGQACPSGASVVLCTFDAYCDSDQICRAKKAPGQTCSTSSECMGSCVSGRCVGSSPTEALSNAFLGLVCGGQKL